MLDRNGKSFSVGRGSQTGMKKPVQNKIASYRKVAINGHLLGRSFWHTTFILGHYLVLQLFTSIPVLCSTSTRVHKTSSGRSMQVTLRRMTVYSRNTKRCSNAQRDSH